MARDYAKALKATFSRQNWIFNLSMFSCVLVGVIAILIAIILKHRSYEIPNRLLIFQLGQSIPGGTIASAHLGQATAPAPTNALADNVRKLITESGDEDHLGADLLRDLGIALLISAFVTIVIERYASNRLREHITYDVLSAAYAKVVPEMIYSQVADNVFRSDIYRRNWEVIIGAKEAGFDQQQGVAIITSSYSYEVENLNEHRIPFEVVGWVDLDVLVPGHDDVPRFTLMEVNSTNGQSLFDQEATAGLSGLLTNPLKQIAHVRKGNLTVRRSAQDTRFAVQVDIPARGRIKVHFEVVRAIRVPGNFVLIATAPADGITIITNIDGFNLDVA